VLTSRKMLRQFQLSTGLRMKIYTKTNFFLAEIKQKSWISCYFFTFFFNLVDKLEKYL